MVPDPYDVAECLWLRAQKLDKLKDKRFEVDVHTLYEMRKDWNPYRSNFQLIGKDGEPLEEYRDGWSVRIVRHIPEPSAVFISDAELDNQMETGETPHMALVATKPNGRQVAFDWEHNHKDLT